MIIKALLGIALAATITGGASVATHQALQSSNETEVQSTASAESNFDANFVDVHSSFSLK